MRNINSLITVLALAFSSTAAVGCATTGADDDELGSVEGETAAAGKFDLWQASNGQWHFHLKSGNGAILLTSEAYTSRTGAINGVLSVQENGVDKLQYKIVPATHGYVVHLVAGNNEIISFSEVYSTKSSATRAVTSCVRAVNSYLVKRETNTTGSRVEVTANDAGKFHFNVFANNGQIVLSSESYTTDAAAFNGAFAVQQDGQDTANYTIKQNAAGGYYFTLSALNGQVIGVSQQYTARASAQSAITSMKAFLPTVSVL